MTMRTSLMAVIAIMLLRWGIGLSYSLTVPAWEAYDEPGHFSYAATLATTERLPTADDAVRNPEAIQPPLYYALMAGMLRLSGTDVTGYQFPDRNPQFYADNGSVNYALQRSHPTTTAKRDEVALRFLRMVTLLITLPAVAIAYRLVRLLSDQKLVLDVLVVFALWPQSLFNGSMVTNDALTLTIGTLLTWLMLRSLRVGLSSRKGVVILLLIGVGALIKLNLLLMVLPFGVLILLTTQHRAGLFIGAILVVVASVIMLSSVPGILLPFNNLSEQGDPILIAVWRNLTSDDGWTLLPDGLRYLVYSSVALFGWGNIALPGWSQVLIVIALGTAAIGGGVGMLRERRVTGQTLLLASIIAAQIAGGTALMLFYQTIHLLNGRYLLPALAAMCVLLVGGWAGLGKRVGQAMLAILTVSLLIAGVAIPPYIASFYARPPAVSYTATTNPPLDYQAGMRLLGYEAAIIRPDAKSVSVSLYWSATQPITDDYFVRIEVIGADGNGYGLFDSIPGHGNHPTTNWIVGEVFRDEYHVGVRSDAPTGEGHLRVTVVAVQHPTDRVAFDLVAAPFDLH